MKDNKRKINIDTKYKVQCYETGEIFENSLAAAEWVIEQGLSIDKKGNIAVRIRKSCRKEKFFEETPIYKHHWNYICGDWTQKNVIRKEDKLNRFISTKNNISIIDSNIYRVKKDIKIKVVDWTKKHYKEIDKI